MRGLRQAQHVIPNNTHHHEVRNQRYQVEHIILVRFSVLHISSLESCHPGSVTHPLPLLHLCVGVLPSRFSCSSTSFLCYTSLLEFCRQGSVAHPLPFSVTPRCWSSAIEIQLLIHFLPLLHLVVGVLPSRFSCSSTSFLCYTSSSEFCHPDSVAHPLPSSVTPLRWSSAIKVQLLINFQLLAPVLSPLKVRRLILR